MTRTQKNRRPLRWAALFGLGLVLMLIAGCSPPEVADPVTALSEPEQSPRLYLAAVEKIRTTSSELSEDELRVLRGLMHRPGYTVPTREAALELLAERDLEVLFSTIEFRLSRLTALQWRRRLCEIIADRGWSDLSPALARAWAYPISGWVTDDFERPEYLALADLHGGSRVMDVVFDIFLTSRGVAQQGLRTSCWTLLHRLGQRDRLVELLDDAAVAPDDAMLIDLRSAATQLGIVPVNREEILWIRKLREPERSEFWSQAAAEVRTLPQLRRHELELRDLSIVIAAAQHEPDLLTRTKDQLYTEVQARLRGTRRHIGHDQSDGYMGTNNQTMRQHREKLTWGDLAAMLMALRAMAVPEVVDHLFDFAERDLKDLSTEYGGVVRLDSQNRFEVIEFLPRVRYHDRKFEAPQAMFDAGYVSAFHFHFHTQRYDNGNYAGPGFGDVSYADATRANCLVLTFINRDTLNLDFYRHGRVVVDLGEIKRAG